MGALSEHQKVFLKAREGATSPIRPAKTPYRAMTNFCMLCRVRDHKFHVNRLGEVTEPQMAPIAFVHRSYSSVRTNVLHCDDIYISKVAQAVF